MKYLPLGVCLNAPHLRGSCLGGTMFVMANMDITVSDYSMDENDDIR